MHLKKFLSGDAQLKYPIMSLYKIALNDSKQNVKLKKVNYCFLLFRMHRYSYFYFLEKIILHQRAKTLEFLRDVTADETLGLCLVIF